MTHESIASFVRRRFADEAANTADPLLAGIHAGDAERLSVRSLFLRPLDDAERHQHGARARWRFLALHRQAVTIQGAFVSLPGVTGEFAEAVAAALQPETIMPNARAVELRRNGVWRIETAAGRVESRAVIFLLPSPTSPVACCGRSTPVWPRCAKGFRCMRRRSRWRSAIAPTRSRIR